MPPRLRRRGAVVTAAAIATLGISTAAHAVPFISLPQVNNDPANGIDPHQSAGVNDVVGGSLVAGAQRVPWATFEQKSGSSQQIFVRALKNGKFITEGNPASLNIDQSKEAEAPSIDFAGTNRTVPWVSWYEPSDHLPGGATNIFASRFDAPNNKWIPEGQNRAADGSAIPSLNIHTDREAENPSVAGGAAVAGNDPVPWVAWQEIDGSAKTDQIFVSRGVKGATSPVDCKGFEPAGGPSVAKFCWQQTGIKRLDSGDTAVHSLDPSLNIDQTRNGIEPDIAFTGKNDTVPWVVWYEKDNSAKGLANNEQVFAAKAVQDTTTAGAGGFHYQAVGNGTARQVNILDAAGSGACDDSVAAEGACSLNLNPAADAEDPRVAAGTLNPANPTTPWVTWSEDIGGGKHGIFVSRLVNGDHFELANGGKPISLPNQDAARPDITFSGNTPYVSYQINRGGAERTVVGHFVNLTTFVYDTGAQGFRLAVVPDLRAGISSACTSDPFTNDGQSCPAGDKTPVFLRTLAGDPQKLKMNQIIVGAWPKISGRPLKLRANGTTRVKLTCPPTHGPRCKGTLRMAARGHTIGRSRFNVRAGRSGRVTVRVSRSGRNLVHRKGHVRVKLSAGTGHRTVTLHA
jgi:hypothetical protein